MKPSELREGLRHATVKRRFFLLRRAAFAVYETRHRRRLEPLLRRASLKASIVGCACQGAVHKVMSSTVVTATHDQWL